MDEMFYTSRGQVAFKDSAFFHRFGDNRVERWVLMRKDWRGIVFGTNGVQLVPDRPFEPVKVQVLWDAYSDGGAELRPLRGQPVWSAAARWIDMKYVYDSEEAAKAALCGFIERRIQRHMELLDEQRSILKMYKNQKEAAQ